MRLFDVDRAAEPTLQGLRVLPKPDDPEGRTSLYPWDRVTRTQIKQVVRWHSYNVDGSPVCEGDGRVALRVGGQRVDRLAQRAQARWFRQAWRDGRLCIEDHYLLMPWGCSAAGATFLLAGIGISAHRVLLVFWRFWHDYPELPLSGGHIVLSRLVAVGSLVFSLAILFGLWHVLRMMRPDNVLSSRIDRRGMLVRLRDGEAQGAWEDLQAIRFTRLGHTLFLFRDGTRIELHQMPPRTRLAVQVIREELLREEMPDRKLVLRQLLLWGLLAWTLMWAHIVATLYVIDAAREIRYGPRDTGAVWWPLGLLYLMPGAVVGLGFAADRLRGLLDRRRTRRKRLQRRAATGTSP